MVSELVPYLSETTQTFFNENGNEYMITYEPVEAVLHRDKNIDLF